MTLFSPRSFLVFCPVFLSLSIVLGTTSAWAKPLVVVDAAHGGSESGVKAGGEVEKDWNVRFAKALEKALVAQGMDVVQARQGDETLPIEKRAETINATQASAVIVLHAERDRNDWIKAPCVVVEPPTQSTEFTEAARWGATPPSLYRASLRLARALGKAFGVGTDLSVLSDSRGLPGEVTTFTGHLYCLPHQSLRYLTLPSVVVVPMFLTSASDVKKFSASSEVDDFAQKVARGVAEYVQ
ncbi:MAG TPA: N-acetylmuramoyl-L-alanine amidase [bacterium]|nr:N-acetylmuramoyl-L-alanine amidase [bacterium]